MRKELYRMLCRELKAIDLIKHIDLWNHNVEFIEQEENWERPAVFVEFCPIQWNAIVPGVEYRAEPLIKLHIVTDWEGSSAEGSELQEDALKVFDLPWVMFGAGMPQDQGWLTGTYMYDQTFNRGNVDYGSTIAMLIVILGVILSNVANRVFRPSDDL